ncbi:hypothetical protein IC582_018823 [Cucumis melo]|uniref:Threonine dehydratase n=2 Tax=Cucumis melo TaxID=3656 RepID=A0A5D3C7Q3_CUCMM|nr:threonine dehydratase biosynthetic [Cucumis melo var. makuwa]
MESFLLTTNPLLGRNSSLSSLPSSSSSISTQLNSKVEIIRRRIEKVNTTTTHVPTSIVASSASKRKTGKGLSANVAVDGSVATVGTVKDVSWTEVQYESGSIGHRAPPPAEVDKDKQMEYITKILGSKVYDVAVETPLELAPLLSTQIGINLYLKREDAQQVFSFKIRGAYNMISQLPKDQLANGVICASAGNHAQGVALSAQRLKIKAQIVMPTTTPAIKVEAVKRLGGKVIQEGETFDESQKIAKEISSRLGITFIPPFDNEDVIAGQGTVGMEIGRQMRGKIHAIIVPIGGGGLAAGIVSFYKLVYPEVKVFGVEPNDENSMAQALYRDEIVNVTDIGHFADGVAVQQVGDETFRICRELLDDVILVTKEEISAAIKDMFSDERSILEPSGALSIAAAKAYCKYNNITGVNIVAVCSGANMNFDQLREISDIANVDQSIICTILPETPGSLQQLTDMLDEDITEMTYRFSSGSQDAVVVYKVSAVGTELEDMVEMLNTAGFTTYTLNDNPVVKNHLRYMTGGRADLENETLFRFTFPERKGALKHFFKDFKQSWNVSLFHHRAQGILTSDVLIGVQLEKSEEKDFHEHLRKVGYKYEVVPQDDAAQVLAKL